MAIADSDFSTSLPLQAEKTPKGKSALMITDIIRIYKNFVPPDSLSWRFGMGTRKEGNSSHLNHSKTGSPKPTR